jgi:hypothetical protein
LNLSIVDSPPPWMWRQDLYPLPQTYYPVLSYPLINYG